MYDVSTADDVHYAARRLSNLETEQVLGEKCRMLSETFTAAAQRADILFQALIENGWTPPGVGVDGRTTKALQEAYDQGYRDGGKQALDKRLTARDSAYKSGFTESMNNAWIPVAVRWRFVKPGDVFVSEGDLWAVLMTGEYGENERWSVDVARGEAQDSGVEVDPDDEIDVLLPAAQAEAVKLAREQLGGRMIGRTT
jgi:hypothetical protein